MTTKTTKATTTLVDLECDRGRDGHQVQDIVRVGVEYGGGIHSRVTTRTTTTTTATAIMFKWKTHLRLTVAARLLGRILIQAKGKDKHILWKQTARRCRKEVLTVCHLINTTWGSRRFGTNSTVCIPHQEAQKAKEKYQIFNKTDKAEAEGNSSKGRVQEIAVCYVAMVRSDCSSIWRCCKKPRFSKKP